MSEAKQRDDWNHTAALLCMTANVNDRKRHRVEEFNPFSKSGGRGRGLPITADTISDLKAAFIRDESKKGKT